VALRDLHEHDVAALADPGVDELVIVDSPPQDARAAADWVSALADRWSSASGQPGVNTTSPQAIRGR